VLKAQNAKSAFIEGNDATSVTLFSLMNVRIRVKAFDEHGIKLIPPTDADFNGLARPLIGRVADIGLKLKPMLVIVSNESPHTVVSYSKTWTARYAGGRTSVIRSHASFPETVCGDILIAKDPEALPPGGKRTINFSTSSSSRKIECLRAPRNWRSSWGPSYSPMAGSLEATKMAG
jgi:hypothetical protein